MIDPFDDDLVEITDSDMAKAMPAARCRECEVVTWRIRLDRGLERLDPKHADGCAKPVGRVDLLAQIPAAQHERFLGGRLLRPMNDSEVAWAAKEVEAWKSLRS